jgi:hypothetical protein
LAIDLDEAGNRLLLLDGQPPALHVYDQNGRYQVMLGREGGGPGEYSFPIDMSVGVDGVAAVLSMSGTVTYWDRQGELLGIVAAGGTGLASEVLSARADSFYVKIDRFPPADVAEFRVSTPDTVLPGVRFRDDSVPGLDTPGSATRHHAYATASTADGDLLLAPPGPDYLIVRFGPDGQPRPPIRRPEVEPLRRAPAEIEAMRQRIRKRFAELGTRTPENLPVPELRNHIARLAVAPDSTLWALTRRGGDSVAVIDAFDVDGTFSAAYRVRLPTADLAVGTRRIYLLALDSLGLPGVAVAARPDARRR